MKIYVFMVVLLLCTLRVEGQTLAQSIVEPLHDTIALQQRSQLELDGWEREKAAALQEIETLLQRKEALKVSNARLEEHGAVLAQKITQSKQAVVQARKLEQEMEPFLRQSSALLDIQVENSLPFNMEERQARVRQLHEEVWAAAVPVAQQFRHLMQVLKSEYDYAHSVEVVTQELEVEGERVFMSHLRIGNLALYALGLEQQRGAHFDPVTREWRWLDPRWNTELSKAVAMGSKQRPVDLLTLPFGSLEQR